MKWVGLIFASALVVLTAAAPAGAVSGLLSNGGRNFPVGDTLRLSVGVEHTGAPIVVDVYLAVVSPGGTSVFLVLTPGGIATSFVPVPLVSGITLLDGLDTGLSLLFAYTFTGDEPTGTYETVLAFVQAGTGTVLDLTRERFTVGGRGTRR